ncbi:sensor histidine kinase [Methanospirillum purgamenti]|uniref:Sensor histidine kinase n=1 Tax=Methanospirillum hungatei TaxID=2203 RepID=A0A8F5ZI77_METHU|nr:sensor histidine kinase [Methanospirillum hungatei]QXO95728.1 sensor histidine kinase [Methanospirillum hungatei]
MPIKPDDFCQVFIVQSKVLSLLIFILIGVLLEYVVHYSLKIPYVYTHIFYLLILLAAIWYKRDAVYLALFFGLLHIVVYYFNSGHLAYEPVFRALMLCMIAYIAGSIVACMTHFRDEVAIQNGELERTKEAFKTANKKLNLLSSITRHDILNQLTPLLGYMDLSEELTHDPAHLEIIHKEQRIMNTIQKQIEFTRNYEDIGVKEPVWYNIKGYFHELTPSYPNHSIIISESVSSLEIFADPLFPLIFPNLIDNSIRHGEKVTSITLSSYEEGDSLILVYEDNGNGIPIDEKEKIFERGYGKNTGMGLFLSREILAITGLSMRESGQFGQGARFEIFVPNGAYRFID